jgi:hypothetical protein
MSGLVSFNQVADGPLVLRNGEGPLEEADDAPKSSEQSKAGSLQRIFKEGDVVRCSVVSTSVEQGKKQSVVLTLKPSAINRGLFLEHLRVDSSIYGAVTSIEDHGYIISFGVEGCVELELPFPPPPVRQIIKSSAGTRAFSRSRRLGAGASILASQSTWSSRTLTRPHAL